MEDIPLSLSSKYISPKETNSNKSKTTNFGRESRGESHVKSCVESPVSESPIESDQYLLQSPNHIYLQNPLIESGCKDFIMLCKQYFNEVLDQHKFSVAYQDLEKEFLTLPGRYSAKKNGHALVVYEKKSNIPIACVALKYTTPRYIHPELYSQFSKNIDSSWTLIIKPTTRVCEIKRMYVIKKYRGLKIGKYLLKKILEAAKSLKMDIVTLDTLKSMKAAQKLYKSFGFQEIKQHVTNPEPENSVFLGLFLSKSKSFELLLSKSKDGSE